jgi:putative FmdB family regulatory protein
MPIYEYVCEDCGKTHEILQKASDAPKTECPACGGELKKLISHSSFKLKGSGFYANDYGSSLRKLEAPKENKRRATERMADDTNVINNTEVPATSTKTETAAK